MKTLDKIIYVKNGSSFLYFFPAKGKPNAYDSIKLNLAKKEEDKIRGANGATKARDFIPEIIKCEWKQQFLNCWLSFQDLNKYLESKGYEVVNYADEFNSLDDFFLFMVKERSKEIGLNGFLKADEIVKLTKKISNLISKINELKDNLAIKKPELNKLDEKLSIELKQVKDLEVLNEVLLEKEVLDTKTFQANSLKIAKIKHSNKELINNRNALYNECENLESEIKSLEDEIKSLEDELEELKG